MQQSVIDYRFSSLFVNKHTYKQKTVGIDKIKKSKIFSLITHPLFNRNNLQNENRFIMLKKTDFQWEVSEHLPQFQQYSLGTIISFATKNPCILFI